MSYEEEPDVGFYEEYVLSGIEDQASEEVAQKYEEIEQVHDGSDPEPKIQPHYPKDENEAEAMDCGDHYVKVDGKYYTHYEKDMIDIKNELQELQLELGAMGIANHDKRVLAISDRIFDIIKKYEKPDPDGEIP